MRLTLRTLLAYLDEMLDPPDADELAKKIAKSEDASNLVHRIRSSTRRLRLGAPKVGGKGMGLDPNTVAEYLDNTLPTERVPDFEKVCLESDLHLAEVAACHQILTLVLGGVADVAPTLRERVYDMGRTASEPEEVEEVSEEVSAPPVSGESEPPVQNQTPPPAPVEEPAGTQPPPKEAEQPDVELDAPVSSDFSNQKRRWLPVALTAGIVLVLGVLGILASGPLNEDHPLIGSFFGPKQTAQADPSQRSEDQPQAAPQPDEETPLNENDGEEAESPTIAGAGADSNEDVRPSVESNADNNQQPQTTTDSGPTAAQPDSEVETGNPAGRTPGAVAGGGPGENPPNRPLAPVANDQADADRGDGGPGGDTTDRVATPAAEEATRDIARLTSTDQVLARLDPAQSTYMRLEPLSQLMPGDRLLAPPSFRPQLLMAPGISLTLAGPTEFQIFPPEEGDLSLAIESGRAVILTDGREGLKLRMKLGTRLFEMTFQGAESTAAVDVSRFLMPGSDPESADGHNVVRIYAAGGPVELTDQDGRQAVIDPRHMSLIVDDREQIVHEIEDTPNWVDGSDLNQLDRSAAKEIEQRATPERPFQLVLQEMIQHRRVEVCVLAIRCLEYMDDFDAYLETLNNRRYRAFWDDQFRSLRASVQRNPETAASLRQSFERLRGPDAATLYRLTWGYDNQQLEEGEAQTLVNQLSSASMDIRVLTFFSLVDIAGRTHQFMPEREPDKNRASLRNWQRSLEEEAIRYAEDPVPLDLRAALE